MLNLTGQFTKAFDDLLTKNAKILEANLKAAIPKGDGTPTSGNLRKSVTSERESPSSIRIGHDTDQVLIQDGYGPYASVVDYGSIVYYGHGIIRPRNKKSLRWLSNGEYVYAKSSPAQPPNDFIKKAIVASKLDLSL